MHIACDIPDLLWDSSNLVVNFEKTGQEVTNRLPLCRLQGHELSVECLASDCHACSVKVLTQGEPHIKKIIRVVDIDPDCQYADIVNDPSSVLMALDKVLALYPGCNGDC